jgi:hypothetical protein
VLAVLMVCTAATARRRAASSDRALPARLDAAPVPGGPAAPGGVAATIALQGHQPATAAAGRWAAVGDCLRLVWGVGVTLTVWRVVRRHAATWSLGRVATSMAPELAAELLAPSRHLLGVRRSVAVKLVPGDVPSVVGTVGLRQPVIFLPQSALGWPVARRRRVLLHEMSHVAHADWAIRAWPIWSWRSCGSIRSSGKRRASYGAGRRTSPTTSCCAATRTRTRTRPTSSTSPPGSRRHTEGQHVRRESREIERRVRGILDPRRHRAPLARSARIAAVAVVGAVVGAAALSTGLLGAHHRRHRTSSHPRAAHRRWRARCRSAAPSAHDAARPAGSRPGCVWCSVTPTRSPISTRISPPSLDILPAGEAGPHVVRLRAGTPLGAGRPGWPAVAADEGLRRILASAVEDQDPVVRARAAWALATQRDGHLVVPLIAALRGADRDGRAAAAWALGQFPDERSLAHLVHALRDADPNVRVSAAYALGQARDQRSLEALARGMRDPVALVRATVVTSLGRLGDASAGPLIRVGLRDADAGVRAAAGEATTRLLRAGGS